MYCSTLQGESIARWVKWSSGIFAIVSIELCFCWLVLSIYISSIFSIVFTLRWEWLWICVAWSPFTPRLTPFHTFQAVLENISTLSVCILSLKRLKPVAPLIPLHSYSVERRLLPYHHASPLSLYHTDVLEMFLSFSRNSELRLTAINILYIHNYIISRNMVQ